MIKFLKDERGDVVLLVYLIMIFCILGVLAFDYSRAHAIHARLQTATDAAALAACMKAEVVPEYKRIVGADGKVRKVRVANLQNRQQQANLAAEEAFRKNFESYKMPVKDVVIYYDGRVRSDKPKYTENGSRYYDKYTFEVTAGVRTFLLAGLGEWFIEAIKRDPSLPKEWHGVIPIRVESTAQAIEVENTAQARLIQGGE